MIGKTAATLLLLTLPGGSIVAQANSPTATTLRCGRLLDTRSGRMLQKVAVVVDRGRVVSVSEAPLPIGEREIDLRDRTCLPGFIDAHTHLLTEFDAHVGNDDLNGLVALANQSDASRALRGAVLAREMLEAGFTTVRDLGNAGRSADVALRDAIQAGWTIGPRMLVSTRAISPLGGQTSELQPMAQPMLEHEYAVITGPIDARRAVRQALFDGADVIKVIVNVGQRSLDLDEMNAIVEESRHAGVAVAAHAIGDSAVRLATEAGVSSIEHGYEISESILQLMADKGTWLVPTDFPADHFLAFYDDSAARAGQAARVGNIIRRRQARFATALRLGVKIALGADAYYALPGQTRGQASASVFRAYVDAGMTPLAAIQAGTIRGAELLRLASSRGVIEAGKMADIVAVDGDPLGDIRVLEHVTFVMHAGAVVINKARRQ